MPNPDASGQFDAAEANHRVGVGVGAIVRMRHVGYDLEVNPRFVFEWGGTEASDGFRIHDHRDNFNGGFAFAVYHPGTALPQMPWLL